MMRRLGVVLVILFLAASVVCAADFKFKCPENIPTEAERDKHYKEFFYYYIKNNPDATVSDFSTYRYKMLEKYNCKETLENIRRNASDDSSNSK